MFISLLAFSGFGQAGTVTDQGEYILRAAGCVACHTDAENNGPFLAGGRAFDTTLGTFYSPNITSDKVNGIGDWTKQQFMDAIIKGQGPDGVHYYPVFPYTSYSGAKLEDIEALFEYLRKVPAVNKKNIEHDLPWYLQFRLVNQIWKFFFFESRTTPINRGEYLVKILGHCDECHTPRSWFGAIEFEQHLSGNSAGPDGESVPNITPDIETGIGRWGRSDLIRYLRNGMLPDGDFAGGAMVDVIDEGLSFLSTSDREAIADYLKGVKPIKK